MDYFIYGCALLASFYYLLLLKRLLAEKYWEFTALFLYVVVLLLTAATDYLFVVRSAANPFGVDPQHIYYANDLLRQAMIYVVVISLIRRASLAAPRFSRLRPWLIPGALAVASIFLLIFRDPNVVLWMTNVVRNLSILGMLLNMALWLLLFHSKSADRTLVLVVSGLGLQTAGEAIGQSLRLMSPDTVVVGNIILAIAHLLCLHVWAQAIRPARRQPQPG